MGRFRKIRVHPYHQIKYVDALRLRKERALTGAEIARRLGLSQRTVNLWLQRDDHRTAVKVFARHVAAYRKALKLRHEWRLSAEKIARRLGLYPRTVGYWLKKERERNTHAEHSEQNN